ncbi:endogenous retrovirus group K member 7 Env polyprotein-like isoform X1 [Equus asinus]|uniref:endogenous retrovirus group K member 7 Env polyprotein-like isoform X1 n=1 Tax=Equus asinus TaxID=9793 RepID=UPI0038F6E40F
MHTQNKVGLGHQTPCLTASSFADAVHPSGDPVRLGLDPGKWRPNTDLKAAQEAVDRKLEAKVNASEEAVLQIGQELTNLKVCLTLLCHVNYRWICITPLQVNASQTSWDKMKNHIPGIWNHSDLTLDLSSLHDQIQAINGAEKDFASSSSASDFFTSLSSFITHHTLSTSHFFISMGIILGFLLIVLLFPVIIRLLRRAVERVSAEVQLASLKNKKGGDAGSRQPTS